MCTSYYRRFRSLEEAKHLVGGYITDDRCQDYKVLHVGDRSITVRDAGILTELDFGFLLLFTYQGKPCGVEIF